MRAHLALVTSCVLMTLAACSGSRRNVKRAPGHPSVFASKLPEEVEVLQPEHLEAAQTCQLWRGAAWCEVLMDRWTFVPELVDMCAAEPDDESAVECLSYAADRGFSLVGLQTCGALDTPEHRRDCLDAIADRRLEPPQYAYCASKRGRKVAGCLEGMHDYTFHPDELQAIVQRTVDEADSHDARTLIRDLEDNIAERYDLEREDWPANYVFNFAGGATTHIRAMYCALDEYLLIVGAPVDVNGYSGRYPAEVHDFVFTGLMHDFEEFDHEQHDFTAGSWAFLPHGGHRVYATETPTYMLEYARGWIPGMLGFGIRHPRRAITRDRKNMKQQIRMCASRALAATKENRKRRRDHRRSKRKTLRGIRRALRGL